MPKKKVSPEQAEINKQYKNARDRLLSRIRRLSKKGIAPLDYTPPKIPKKKTQASIRNIEKEIKRLENKTFINLNTGELTDYTSAKKTRKPKTTAIPTPTLPTAPQPKTPSYSTDEETQEEAEEFDEEGYDLYERYLDAIDGLPPAREFSFGRGRHRRVEIRDYSEYIEQLKNTLISRFEEAESNGTLKQFFDELRDNEEEFFDLVQEIINYAGDPIKKFNELFSIVSNRPITIQDRINTAPLYAATQPNFEIK